MPGPPVRLLVSGALRLGRTPARVPPGDPALGAEAVLRVLVDAAIERSVDAVVLAGDAADDDFEAAGPLRRALGRLVEAGIPTFAVAGGGDAGALADSLDAPLVHVLGRGGRWEAAPLVKDGREVLRVIGWSPAGSGASLPGAFPEAEGDVPVLAVVGADADDDVWGAGAAAWVVGGSHAPRAEERDGRLLLRPGAPQPLGPDQPGPHGPWAVTVDGDGATAELLPLATVRYDALVVDVDGATDAAELRECLVEAVRQRARAAHAEAPALRRLALRLRIEGRTAAFRDVAALAAEVRETGEVAAAGPAVTVWAVEEAARPPLDLGRLAAGSGPVALLAGLAQRLDAGEPSDADLALVRRSVEAVRAARRAQAFEPLRAHGRLDEGVEAEAVRRLRRQAFRLLDGALDGLPVDGAPPAPPAAAPAP